MTGPGESPIGIMGTDSVTFDLNAERGPGPFATVPAESSRSRDPEIVRVWRPAFSAVAD